MTTTITEKIYAAFDELSQRNTRPRRLIADRLVAYAQAGADFSTEDLWQELRQLDPRIGRATVFRSIEKLVERRLLDRIEFADGSHRYRVCGDSHHHHHLTCIDCHRVVEVEVCLPKEQLSALASQTHFAIEDHSISLFGYCSTCRTS